jgi:tetratricopeptide (TPR) repeat protein
LDEAESFFRRALEINEGSAAAQYGLGQAALSKRNYATAVSFLEEAQRLAPEANRLHYALAMAYRGLGQMEKAQSHLALSGSVGVRASDPLLDGLKDLVKGARLHLIRGKAALDARRFSEAADEFRKAIVEQPDSIPAHFNLGAALTQTGDLRGAVEQFQETLRLDPAHANAHYNLAILLAQADQHTEAITHLRLTLGAEPNDNNARFLLARELVKARQPEEAASEFSRVIETDPANEDALLGLVKILLVKKQYALALSALEKGHAQFPQKGLTMATLAYLLAATPELELRDGRRALALAEAVYGATGSINHGALVAMALAELGRCDEATVWLKRMNNKATEEGNRELAEKLKAELNRYERERPCRPSAGIIFSDQAPAQ